MKMTKKDALNIAISTLNSTDKTEQTAAALEILSKMSEQLVSRGMSDEAKTKRKEKTAAARAELVAQVAPVLRKYLTAPMTAKELFAAAQGELPTDFTAPKVQNILIREMAPELVKTEVKNKANTYELIKK